MVRHNCIMKTKVLGLTIVLLVSGCSHKAENIVTPREQAKAASSSATNAATLQIPFRLGTDESNAALLGRECAVIWFASESKTLNEQAMNNDIVTAATLAKALGVSYSLDQFRNAFKKTEHKAVVDFDTLFPEMINREKGKKIRDMYLFSFWCTASRNFALLVPLWKDPKEQNVVMRWVTAPLANAEKVAGPYDPDIALACDELEVGSLAHPLDTFEMAGKFADEVLRLQKEFLSKYMTADQVAMVVQPLLEKRQK